MSGVDIGLVIGIVSALAGAIAWFRNLVRSLYAKERQLGHIETAILQNNENLKTLFQDAEETLNELNRDDRQIMEILSHIGDRLTRIEMMIQGYRHHG